VDAVTAWLSDELAAARARAGLTQGQVAEAMDWSATKMSKIEAGIVGIRANDLRPLLAFYGVTDPAYVAEILARARAERGPGGPVAATKHARARARALAAQFITRAMENTDLYDHTEHRTVEEEIALERELLHIVDRLKGGKP
jgi:transcriptional regulator with XRE-family HTH domain